LANPGKLIPLQVAGTTAPAPEQTMPFVRDARIWIFSAIAFALPVKASFAMYSFSASRPSAIQITRSSALSQHILRSRSRAGQRSCV
jgi:hypothetical protein